MSDWKPVSSPTSPQVALGRLIADPTRRERVTHVEIVPARTGRHADWPSWAPQLLIDRLGLAGISAPWEHQIAVRSPEFEDTDQP